MIIIDEYTSEYVYKNIIVDETRNIVDNTVLEYERKNAAIFWRMVKVKSVVKFLEKRKNERKNIIIERYNIFGEVNKMMQSTKGMCKIIGLIELKVITKGGIYDNVITIHLKNDNFP